MHAEEQRGREPGQPEGGDKARNHARASEYQPLPHHLPKHLGAGRAARQADARLTATFHHLGARS